MPGKRTTSTVPILAGVPPSVSTQNLRCSATLVTFRWKWPTTIGASVLASCAEARAASTETSAAVTTARRKLVVICIARMVLRGASAHADLEHVEDVREVVSPERLAGTGGRRGPRRVVHERAEIVARAGQDHPVRGRLVDGPVAGPLQVAHLERHQSAPRPQAPPPPHA